MLYDKWGRPLQALRINVTQDCNYNCIYCHREGWSGSEEVLKPEELAVIASAARELGILEFKITGGEPTLRNDLVEVVKALASVKPRDLSMTTNGVFLHLRAASLAEAGLMRVNVSLPSLRRDVYKYITGADGLEAVLKGVRVAIDCGLHPVTLNVVVMKGINEWEFKDFIDFASKEGLRLRFIELEPISIPEHIFIRLYKGLDYIADYLEAVASKKYFRSLHHRPVYVMETGIEVELVRWYRNCEFCLHCNRVRLTADGILRPCIFAREGVDLKPLLRPKMEISMIKEAIMQVNEARAPYNCSFNYFKY